MGATTSSNSNYPPMATTTGGSGGSSGLLMPPNTSVAMLGGTPSGSSLSVSGGGGGGSTYLSLVASGSGGGPHFREQRRKRVTGFATLKRKFIRRRRSSKACDHARIMREFVADWTPLELAALCEEYEALAALRDLAMQAELARPPAATYKQDLAALYDMKTATDCDLVFRGTIFPVHRSILSARCSYFRDLLAASCVGVGAGGGPGQGARICLELPSSPIDVQMFSSLLRYLYTGDLCPHDASIDVALLRQLGDDFGTPNPLDHDLRYLLETGDYADAALVFTSDGGGGSGISAIGMGVGDYHRPDTSSTASEYGFRPKLELPCHKAILSARSPFFRNLIARRTRNVDEYTEQRAMHTPTRIVLDESVIPKRYARVLLHAIYLDTVDLSLILRGAGAGSAAGSLGEVHALTHTGRARPTSLEEAMELYQIGRFLDLDILAQGCEDQILEWLSLDTLPTVLRWGAQAHGSAWVFRQACQYLREEFAAVSASPVLHQLDRTQLRHVLHSNFLQASELEVLQAVLKWGEQELIRRMEDREPNLLTHTAHSVARKGVKKRDLSDVELREILSELLPLVRMDHVLPPHSEALAQAIRRGLVSTPPSHMIGDERENLRVNAWIRGGKNQGLFVRPRLFMPYFEEVKALLEDRMSVSSSSASHHHHHHHHHNHHHQAQAELMRLRRARHLPDIPDTLYMVSRMNAAAAAAAAGSGGVGVGIGADGVDMLATTTPAAMAAAAAAIPPPDAHTLAAMLKREHKLRQSPMCQRAIMLPLSAKHEIDRQIRLRVVREFNLPDAVSDLLETSLLGGGHGGGGGGGLGHGRSGGGMCGAISDDGGVGGVGGGGGGLGVDGHSMGLGGGGGIVASNTQTGDSSLLLLEDDDQSPPPSPAANTAPGGMTVAGSMPRHGGGACSSSASSYLSGGSMSSASVAALGGAPNACGGIIGGAGIGGGGEVCYSRNLTFPRQQHAALLGLSPGVSGVGGGGGGSGGATLVGVGSAASSASYARLSASVHHRNDLPALITEGDYRRFPHGSALGLDVGLGGGAGGAAMGAVGGCAGGGGGMAGIGHLSDMMPDVAMATASLGQLHLANGAGGGGGGGGSSSGGGSLLRRDAGDMPDSLQLDLGDGPSHMLGGGGAGPSGSLVVAGGPIQLRGLQQQQHQMPPPPAPSNYHHFLQQQQQQQQQHQQQQQPQHHQHHHAHQPPASAQQQQQRANSPFDILRQGQHSPAPPHHGTYSAGPPRFL